MSHTATIWALQQRGLTPAQRVVLFYLADRHNPDYGCFPKQNTLAADAEISVSSLNDHLAYLEERGLIRRERRIHPETRRQMSTRYILAFE
ncbi:MAG: helix-turn-helix domain-containing protein, partial [Paracoccus sp. (in: a-proteobacteria)]|nr:helix-turn-helix domain-containing protein [Paracoccus sp. (in: a-proteobacteria)]